MDTMSRGAIASSLYGRKARKVRLYCELSGGPHILHRQGVRLSDALQYGGVPRILRRLQYRERAYQAALHAPARGSTQPEWLGRSTAACKDTRRGIKWHMGPPPAMTTRSPATASEAPSMLNRACVSARSREAVVAALLCRCMLASNADESGRVKLSNAEGRQRMVNIMYEAVRLSRTDRGETSSRMLCSCHDLFALQILQVRMAMSLDWTGMRLLKQNCLTPL